MNCDSNRRPTRSRLNALAMASSFRTTQPPLTDVPEKFSAFSLGLADELRVIADRCATLPVLDARTADEILDYDEHGFPSR
jgi:hypothetical protein